MKTLDDIERHAFADGDTKTVALVQQMQDVIEEEAGGESAEEAYDRGRTDARNGERDFDELEAQCEKYQALLLELLQDMKAPGLFDRKDWARKVGAIL